MYKYLLFLFAVWSHLDAKSLHKIVDYEAYYWRDFNGVLPPDAFSAGTYNNKVLYIVQVLHKGLLIPGRLDEGMKIAHYEYDDKVWSTNKNIKIFCTNFPNLFEWYKTNSSSFVNEKTYIIGGYEPQHTTFIGRGIHGDDLLIGKIVFDKGSSIYLHTTQQERSVRLLKYEVLSFTPLYVTEFSVTSLVSTSAPPINLLHLHDAYYWRDFKGTIPFDAFSAGVDSDGDPIYIVQQLYKELLIPGTLYKDKSRSAFEYGDKQWHSSDNFKILCTNYPQFLNWKKTDSCSFLTSDQNIIGGYEPSNSVFIGRGRKDNQLLVGKIIYTKDSLPLLHTTQNDKAVRLKLYEVLVFQLPNKNVTTLATIGTTIKITPATAPSKREAYTARTTKTTLTTHKTTTASPKTLVVTSDFDLKTFVREQVGSALVVSEDKAIEPNLNRNDSNDCKCGQRVYVININ